MQLKIYKIGFPDNKPTIFKPLSKPLKINFCTSFLVKNFGFKISFSREKEDQPGLKTALLLQET